MIPKYLRPFARERITVSSSAKKLTRSVYEDDANVGSVNQKRAQAAQIYVVGDGSIYYTLDGTTPSATAGAQLAKGDVLDLQSMQAVRRFQAIRSGSDDSDLEVTYYA